MRRFSPVLFILLLLAAASSKASAQQSIYMVLDSIKGDQPAPHANEFRLTSYSASASNSTSMLSGTGMSAGKASFGPVKASMRFVPLSNGSLHRLMALGSRLGTVEIRFYNSTNRVFYRTVYESAFLTNLAMDAADEAQQQMEFNYSKVTWYASPDASGAVAPVKIGCWDIAAYRSC
jgi:type VI protein secretion system component Hcp